MNNKVLLATLLSIGLTSSLFAETIEITNATPFDITPTIFFSNNRKVAVPTINVDDTTIDDIAIPSSSSKVTIHSIVFKTDSVNTMYPGSKSWIIVNPYDKSIPSSPDVPFNLTIQDQQGDVNKYDGSYETAQWDASLNKYIKKQGKAQRYQEDI